MDQSTRYALSFFGSAVLLIAGLVVMLVAAVG